MLSSKLANTYPYKLVTDTGICGCSPTGVSRIADERRVAQKLFALGFKIGTANLPEKNVRQFVRNRMDDLGIGADLERFPYGKKKFVTLPPSRLKIPLETK